MGAIQERPASCHPSPNHLHPPPPTTPALAPTLHDRDAVGAQHLAAGIAQACQLIKAAGGRCSAVFRAGLMPELGRRSDRHRPHTRNAQPQSSVCTSPRADSADTPSAVQSPTLFHLPTPTTTTPLFPLCWAHHSFSFSRRAFSRVALTLEGSPEAAAAARPFLPARPLPLPPPAVPPSSESSSSSASRWRSEGSGWWIGAEKGGVKQAEGQA